MVKFEDLSLKDLRSIVKKYNLHYHISGYSTMSKDKLITEMKKHLKIDENNMIKSLITPFEQEAPFKRTEKSTFSKAYYDIMKNPFVRENVDPKQLEFLKQFAKPMRKNSKRDAKIKEFVENFEEKIKEKPIKKSKKEKKEKSEKIEKDEEIDVNDAIKKLQEMISKKEEDIKFWNKKLEGSGNETYNELHKYSVSMLKQLIRNYNLHTKIKLKQTKEKLIQDICNHLEFDGQNFKPKSFNIDSINKKILIPKKESFDIMEFNPSEKKKKVKEISEKIKNIKLPVFDKKKVIEKYLKLKEEENELLRKVYNTDEWKLKDYRTELKNYFLNAKENNSEDVKKIKDLMKEFNITFTDLYKRYPYLKDLKNYDQINLYSIQNIRDLILEKLGKESNNLYGDIMAKYPNLNQENLRIQQELNSLDKDTIKEYEKEIRDFNFNEAKKWFFNAQLSESKKDLGKKSELEKFDVKKEREKIKKIAEKSKGKKFELPEIKEKKEDNEFTQKSLKKLKFYDLEKLAVNLHINIAEETGKTNKEKLIKKILNKIKEEDNEDETEEDTNKIIIDKNDKLIDLTERIFKTSQGRLRYYKKNYNKEFEDLTEGKLKLDFVDLIKNSQKQYDFYPTPLKCLEPFKHWIKQSSNFLEPCAGLGFISNFVRKNKDEYEPLSLIEYNPEFKEILNYFNPDCNIYNEGNFLNFDIDNNFDCIIINPPFSNGTDKKYYLDFVYHSMYLLSKSKARKLKNLLVVAPSLTKDMRFYSDKKILSRIAEHGSDFVLMDMLEYTGKAKLFTILNKYIKVSKKDIDKLFDQKENSKLYEKIDDLFSPFYMSKIGECSEFVNTKFKAHLYHIQIGYSLTGYGSKEKKESHNGYALHAVLVSSKIPYDEAFKEAQNIMKKKKFFSRETKLHHRFRNIPKQKFEPKTFRSHKVNKDITLVVGKLKPEHMHLEGAGLFDWIKNKASSAVNAVSNYFKPREGYNNLSTKTINDYGNIPIKQLFIMRAPIQSMLNNVINFVSLGKWNELKQKYEFDKLFHLSLVARLDNGKNIILEKNEVVNISPEFKNEKDAETLEIPFTGQLTIKDILDTAQKNVGDSKFFLYDPFTNNCQYFIKYLLEGQGLYSEQAKNFLFQDLKQIYEGLPSYVPKVMKGATTMGAIFNKILGKGKKKGDIVISQKDFIKEHKHLVKLLEHFKNNPQLLAEAKDQAEELKKLTGVDLLGKGKKKKVYKF